jgi:hypothetical protein
MPKELLLSGRMTQATDIYSFGLISEWRRSWKQRPASSDVSWLAALCSML